MQVWFTIVCFLIALTVQAQEGEREAFLKQFAKDPSVVKEAAPVAAATEAGSGSGNAMGSGSGLDKDPDSELEAMINQMQEDSEKQKKFLESIKAGSGAPGAGGGIKQFVMTTTPDGKQDYGAIVAMILTPYQKLNPAQLEALLVERFGKHPFAGPLLQFPTMRKFMVRMVQHKDALPRLAAIGQERQKLATYGGFVLVTFFLGSLLKRLLARLSSDNVGASLRRFLFRVLFMTGLRFGAFFTMFSKNFAPTWDVIKGLWS